MELEIKNQSDQMTYLALRGRLDTAGVGEIELSFTSHTVPRAKPLLLDISDVTFLASLGLRMLLTVAKALDRRGAKTVLLSPQPAVREVLKLSGFDQLMPVHNDEGTALAFLAESEGVKIPWSSLAAHCSQPSRLPIGHPLGLDGGRIWLRCSVRFLTSNHRRGRSVCSALFLPALQLRFKSLRSHHRSSTSHVSIETTGISTRHRFLCRLREAVSSDLRLELQRNRT